MADVKVIINKNASMKIESDKIEVILPDGTVEIKLGKAFFCRCGQSKKQPYCDGTHKICGFQG